jgi:hypothetical protein
MLGEAAIAPGRRSVPCGLHSLSIATAVPEWSAAWRSGTTYANKCLKGTPAVWGAIQEKRMTTRTFAFIIGIVFLALGLLGFVPALLTPPPARAPDLAITAFEGYLFGIFPVNYFLNLAHMALGAWGIAAARGTGGSRAYAKTLAVFCAAFAILGVTPAMKTLFGLAPFYGSDVWLHATTAVVAAFFGWVWNRKRSYSPAEAVR